MQVGNGDDGLAQAFTLGDTYLFGANIVNAFRLTANRIAGGKILRTCSRCLSGQPISESRRSRYCRTIRAIQRHRRVQHLAVSGGSDQSRHLRGQRRSQRVRGNHQLAFGVNAAMWWVNSYSDAYHTNCMSFNGQTTGLGMADFFTGQVSPTLQWAPPRDQNKRVKYIRAVWRRHLEGESKTDLELWSALGALFPDDSTWTAARIHFDMDAIRKGIKSTRFTNAPPGVFFPGRSRISGQAGHVQAMVEFFAAPRTGMGCGGGWPHVRPGFGGNVLRLSCTRST